MKHNKTHNVVAIIPARYASSRFPGKPLVEIKGKTLIQRTYENTKRCSLLDRIIVATDDQRIYDHVASFGAEVVMTPVDILNGSDRLAFVVEQDKKLQNAEIIVNVQGDEPCLDPEVINKLVEILHNDPSAVMSTIAIPLSPDDAHNSNCVKCVIDLHGNALYFSRALIPGNRTLSYKSDIPFYRHVGIYAFRPAFLLQYGKLPNTPLQLAEDLEQLKVLEHGHKIKIAVVAHTSADVNTPEDIKKVEQELCKQNSFSSQAESVRH